MSVIIFGATGFIGSHIAEQFSAAGKETTIALRGPLHSDHLHSLFDEHHQVQVDFSSEHALSQSITGHKVVCSCIASRQMHNSYENLSEVEVVLNNRLIRAAAAAGAQHFLLLSTVMVYGFSRPAQAINETYAPDPVYNFNRVAFAREVEAIKTAKEVGIALTILRPANTIGRRDSQMGQVKDAILQGVFPIFRRTPVQFSGVDTRDIGRAMVFLSQIVPTAAEVYLLKGYESSWPELFDKMRQQLSAQYAKATKARLFYLPQKMMLLVAKCIEALTPYGKNALLTPFNVAVMSTDCVFDDSKIKTLGFECEFTLDEAIADFLAGDNNK